MLKALGATKEEYLDWERLKKVLPKDKISVIKLGEKNLLIPLAGRITAQSIYDYLGQNVESRFSKCFSCDRKKN